VVIHCGQAEPGAQRGRTMADSSPWPGWTAAFPLPGQLGLASYIAAIALYALIGALAFAGGTTVLRIEAVLLTVVLFLGFNVAWLLLFDDAGQSRARSPDE